MNVSFSFSFSISPSKEYSPLGQTGLTSWDFSGGALVKTPSFHCKGLGFDPWLGN